MTNTILLLLLAVGYGVTMKVADLLNEHGLKLFRYSDLVFGLLWGACGALLVAHGGTVIANMVLAMNVAFIFRKRLDYLNHQLAAGIIFLSFLLLAHFSLPIFSIFGIVFLVFGAIKDYGDDKLDGRGKWHWLSEAMLYYPLPTLIYCVLNGDWIIFWVFALYTLSYNLVKSIARGKGFV